MAIRTPSLEKQHQALSALSSRYINVEDIPWQETKFQGIWIKVLMEDPDTGLQTVLTKMAPGAVLTDHQHVQLEQSWVLEGSLVDHEGTCAAGNYVWRPAGSRHSAHAPNGALVLGFFLKPNHFFEDWFMAKRVALIHPQSGLMKPGFYGFSWTFLFFGWLVPVFRGELLVGLLHLAITVVTFGLWQLIIAFLYNKQYMTRMLEKGYVLNDNEAVNEAARQKLGIVKI